MRLTVARKILLGFGIMIAMTVGTGWYAVTQFSAVSERTTRIVERDIRLLELFQDLTETRSRRKQARDRILEHHLLVKAGLASTTAGALSELDQEIRRQSDFLRTSLQDLETDTAEFERTALTEGRKVIWGKLRKIARECQDLIKEVDAAGDLQTRMAAAGEWDKLLSHRETVQQVRKGFDDKIEAGIALVSEATQLGSVEVKGDYEEARFAIQLILAAVLVAGLTFAVFILRSITRPLLSLVDASAAIAKGDLTRPELPESADEPGRLAASFNLMAQSLRKVLTEAKQTTGEVNAASRQISAAAQQQVTSMTQSVSSVNEITATAEEFKTTIQEFADRAKTVGEAADETAKRAGEGRALSQACAEKTDQVRANAEAAGESVLALAEQMQKISEITAAVNEIAEQTKLLALNASIEAARAGEEGRGFAVVATQVRELANQSKEAAGRISATIGAAQRSMQGVVGKIEEAGRLSGDSAEGVQKMAGSFQEIAAAIAQTTQAMKQIAAGAKQQEAGIGELAGGIAQIDSGAKQSLASAQQTLKSIQMIEQRSQTLNATMATFKTA